MLIKPEAKVHWFQYLHQQNIQSFNFFCTFFVLKVGKLSPFTLCCVLFLKILSSELYRMVSALAGLYLLIPSINFAAKSQSGFKSGECAHWTSMWHFYWYRNATFRILHSYCATPIGSSILSMSQLCNSVHKVLSKEFGKKEKKPCHCETQATWTPQPELFILSWKYTWLLFSLAALRLSTPTR